MHRWAAQWWEQLRIQHKVWTVLLLLCIPLIGGLATHLHIVQQLLSTQQQRHELVLALEHIELLQRLAIDIEDGFRGYVLTQQPAFLAPLTEAESKVGPALVSATRLMEGLSGPPGQSRAHWSAIERSFALEARVDRRYSAGGHG